MKAGLGKPQLLTLVVGVVLVGGGGILAWLGLGGLGEKQAEAQALAERMGNPALAALLSDPGGASRASREATEIQKLAKDLRDKDAVMVQWSQATEELAGNGQDWSKDPGKWKDRLISIQSQLQKEAKVARVELAPDFYLGLDGFRQRSPAAEEVPKLAMHLSVAERLVRLLLEARKVKEQYPTPCEFKTLSGPGSDPEKSGQASPASPPAPGAKPSPAGVEMERKAFRVEIRSSPEVLYEYVRLLVADPALLIVTDLKAANEKQTFPLRSEIAKKFSEPPSPAAERNTEKTGKSKRLLEILAGEESVATMLAIDFVAWKNPEESKTGAPSAPSP